MTVDENTRVTILLCLSVLLTICQVITATAVIILLRAFLILKKKFLEYENNLPLVRIETPQYKEATAETTTSSTAAATAERNKSRWHVDGEEAIKVPSPLPNRRLACAHYAPSVPDFTIAVPRTQSTSGQKLLEVVQDLSFASFSSPRDSGIGSTSTRSPYSSISDDSQKAMQDSFSKRDEISKLTKRMSHEFQGGKTPRDLRPDAPCESGRTSSSASCGPPRSTCYPLYGTQSLKIPRNEPFNENDIRPSRLKTMAIEMVGLDDIECPGERKSKRASKLLKQMQEEEQIEEPTAIEDVVFENQGYSDSHEASNRNSSELSKRVTLASEESVSSLNSESLHLEINNNDVFRNEDCEVEERYVNQEIVNAMRNESIGTITQSNTELQDQVYVNSVA